MWVLLRFGFAGLVFLFRFLWRRQGVEKSSVYADTRQVLFTERKTVGGKGDRHEIIAKIYWGLEFRTPLMFSFQRETRLDRALKWLGLATELQTGDAEFDRRIYVEGDHPALHRLLRENARLRAALLALMARTAARIFSDGRHLWVESAELAYASAEDLRTLHGIMGHLRSAEPPRAHWFFDRFLWTAVFLEALVWSVALYGVPGLIETLHREITLGHGRMYFDLWALARPGLLLAGAAFVVLAGLTVLLLRGSSRGRRVLAECLVVLVLGLPVAGIQAVDDYNRSRDSAPAAVHEYRVVAKEERRHRRRTSYLLRLEPATAGAPGFAAAYPVRPDVYANSRVGGSLRFTVRTGRFGLPWIEHPDRR